MKKNLKIQEIRGICIICVILIHILSFSPNIDMYNQFNIIVRTIINFAVGIFLFLSGYLNNVDKISKNKNEFYKKRFSRLYIPFIIYSVLYTVINNKLQFINNSFMEYIKTIIRILLGMNVGHLYYIIVLLEFVIITPIIISFINKNKKIIDILLILITPIFLILNFICNLLYNRSIPFYQYLPMSWFIYYYLGLVLKIRKNLFIKNIKININVIICISLISIVINLIEYKFLNYSFITSQVKFTNMIYTILLIYFIINKLNYNKEKKNIFSLLGDNSFGIYFIHMFIITLYDKLIFSLKLKYYIYIILMFILVTGTSYIIMFLIKKIFKERWSKYLGG